jgi:hypothetical protein
MMEISQNRCGVMPHTLCPVSTDVIGKHYQSGLPHPALHLTLGELAANPLPGHR